MTFVKCLLRLVSVLAVCSGLSLAQPAGLQVVEPVSAEVALDNLNIHIDIPLVNKKGIGLPLNIGLHFNNNIWFPGPTQGYKDVWQSIGSGLPGNGWSGLSAASMFGGIVQPYVTPCGEGYGVWPDYTGFIDSNGNEHFFSPIILNPNGGHVGSCFTSGESASILLNDGSGITVNISYNGPYTATYPDGTVFTLEPSAQVQVADVNGNKIASAVNGPPTTLTITDTINVTALTETWNSGTNGCYSTTGTLTYTYPTSTGSATITVNCTEYPVQTNFGCPQVSEASGYSAWLPTSILLPDRILVILSHMSSKWPVTPREGWRR